MNLNQRQITQIGNNSQDYMEQKLNINCKDLMSSDKKHNKNRAINDINIKYKIFQIGENKLMSLQMNEQEALFQELKIQLIPNLYNLDPQVQEEVTRILHIITSQPCTRQQYAHISILNLLEETPLLRSHIWKILLGTMGCDWTKWNQTRQKNQDLYQALKQKFCPCEVQYKNEHQNENVQDFDLQLWNQIAMDTKRTHSTINFFQSEINFTKVYGDGPTKHSDVMTRILYVWSKTNSSVRYVQGMNQILAPLYYLQFQWMSVLHWDRQSQAFSMFSAIMSYVLDMHIKEMDDCETGILGRMVYLNRYLRLIDPQLWEKMEKEGIYPQCYSFRWLALFLAQQFGIYDTIRLWDHIFSYSQQNRFFFVYSLCLAILLLRKEVIMQLDFTYSLPMIQKLRDMEIDQVINLGTALFKKNLKMKINEEYEKRFEGEVKLESSRAVQIHLNKGSWSYSDIVKHASNYVSKSYLVKLATFQK